MTSPARIDPDPARDERCLPLLSVMLDGTSTRRARRRARRHASSCPACRADLAMADRIPLLPAVASGWGGQRAPARSRVAQWAIQAAVALLALLSQGCLYRSDAPCVTDGDCRAAGDVCDEGRCTRPGCVEGDLRPCVVGDGGGCVGVRRCEGGALGVCEAPPERCDGLDDDCDGLVDEQVGAGAPCRRGQGACAADGVEVCDPAGGGFVCDAEAGSPAVEVCNGVDDDCDGSIDEVAGVGQPCRIGVGACAADGLLACDLAAGLVCRAEVAEPAVEVCNGVDDDCDGVVDDVDDVGDPCRVGVGACAAEGVVRCGPDGPACDALPARPGLELCGNRVDDDCDGEVDDRASCVAGCGNGRREMGEGCDDGGVIDGDGCSAACQVEPGYACLDGPPDTPLAIDGRVDCAGWAPVDVPPWMGGYGVAYAGGAVAVSADPPRYAVAYAVRVGGPEGPVDLTVGVVDGRLEETETRDAAVDAHIGRFDALEVGPYEVTFPDGVCADNDGLIDLELRTLDDCRPACEADAGCRHLGHVCVAGRCLPPGPACGDGARDDGEACDDGGLIDGDGCSAGCMVEPGYVCEPIGVDGTLDIVPGSGLIGPAWRILDDGFTVLQQNNAAPSHYATQLPISTRYVTRFTLEVRGFDDDFIGWTIGGGATPLTAPEQPFLLFSWKQATQSEPGYGLAPRGLRVGLVTGPTDHIALWQFGGETLELLTTARTVGAASYVDRQAYEIGVIGDGQRLEIYVDGVLEFDLADAPIGDGRLGFYNYSQEAVFTGLVAPRALDRCAADPG